MKNKKFNILILVSFFILLSVLFSGYYNYNKMVKNSEKIEQETIEKYCQNGYQGTEREDFCEKALNKEKSNPDFFTVLTNVVIFSGATDGIGFRNLSYIMILFIIIPTLYYVCRYLKNNGITNESTRRKYKKGLKKFFINAYKPALILPLIGIAAIIVCYCAAPNLDYLQAVENGTANWSASTLSNPYLFMFLYVINLLIHGVLFVNISLCISRKYHNFFVALILSFLIYLAIEVILEAAIGGILMTTILHLNSYIVNFNIMNMFNFNDTNGMFFCLLIPLVLMVISSIIVLKLYSSKEKLITDCEKNAEEAS